MMEDDDRPKKLLAHDVGMPLDSMSIEELTARIEILRAEIDRLEASIRDKSASRSAAESFFKL